MRGDAPATTGRQREGHGLSCLVAALLCTHACITDLRQRVIRNAAVGSAGLAAVALHTAAAGRVGAWQTLWGAVCGLVWLPAMWWAGLGAGDVKLAVALGALLGPSAAVEAPALGMMVCALGLGPWILWMRFRRRPWRGLALPLAPWITGGLVLFQLGGSAGRRL